VSGSGISWAICKSAPCSRQTTTPAPHHSFFTGRMPFLPPNQQRQSTEGKIHRLTAHKIDSTAFFFHFGEMKNDKEPGYSNISLKCKTLWNSSTRSQILAGITVTEIQNNSTVRKFCWQAHIYNCLYRGDLLFVNTRYRIHPLLSRLFCTSGRWININCPAIIIRYTATQA